MQRVAKRLGLLADGATAHKRASDQSKIESYELGIAERHGWGLLLLDSEPLLGDDTTSKLASASGGAELFFWLTQSATAGLWFESHSGGRLRRKWVEVESQVLENIGAPLPQEPPGVFNGDPDEEGERDEFKLMALAEAVTGVTTDELFSMPFAAFRRTRL
jgi:hypothetical protein